MSALSAYRIERFLRRFLPKKRCPEIRWEDVVRIEAMVTDAFSGFQIWLTIRHSDGSEVEVFRETKGYYEIVESLHRRFPSISPAWYGEMAKTPWHGEKVLYSRDEEW
jgi:hypothetical protein